MYSKNPTLHMVSTYVDEILRVNIYEGYTGNVVKGLIVYIFFADRPVALCSVLRRPVRNLCFRSHVDLLTRDLAATVHTSSVSRAIDRVRAPWIRLV
jgi:hypothetical protein